MVIYLSIPFEAFKRPPSIIIDLVGVWEFIHCKREHFRSAEGVFAHPTQHPHAIRSFADSAVYDFSKYQDPNHTYTLNRGRSSDIDDTTVFNQSGYCGKGQYISDFNLTFSGDTSYGDRTPYICKVLFGLTLPLLSPTPPWCGRCVELFWEASITFVEQDARSGAQWDGGFLEGCPRCFTNVSPVKTLALCLRYWVWIRQRAVVSCLPTEGKEGRILYRGTAGYLLRWQGTACGIGICLHKQEEPNSQDVRHRYNSLQPVSNQTDLRFVCKRWVSRQFSAQSSCDFGSCATCAWKRSSASMHSRASWEGCGLDLCSSNNSWHQHFCFWTKPSGSTLSPC